MITGRIDYDELVNPMTSKMTKKQLNALKQKNKELFYSGIYASDTIWDHEYYKKHKDKKNE